MWLWPDRERPKPERVPRPGARADSLRANRFASEIYTIFDYYTSFPPTFSIWALSLASRSSPAPPPESDMSARELRDRMAGPAGSWPNREATQRLHGGGSEKAPHAHVLRVDSGWRFCRGRAGSKLHARRHGDLKTSLAFTAAQSVRQGVALSTFS